VGARGEIVGVGERLKHLGRELQPGPVERRNVAPMPATCIVSRMQ
jgi:hypothetical protein